MLAARLSEDPAARVLLLEAGGAERTRAMTVPDAWPGLLGTTADWADITSAQADAGPVPYPRGRALGGSGAINAMAHVRGHRAVYDSWAAAGAPGWGFAGLLPYFRRSEHAVGKTGTRRCAAPAARSGSPRSPRPDRHPVAAAFAAALTVAGTGCPAADDLSGAQQEGVAWVDLAIDGGQRVSPADAYLTPARHRPNLVIQAGCLVTGLQMRHGRCTGVRYLRDGAPPRRSPSGEVIVCAGAVGSAHLLMLSGIGPGPASCAPWASTRSPTCPAPGRTCKITPSRWPATPRPRPLPRSRYNHGEIYAAVRSPLAGDWPDVQLFPILLPMAPAGHQPPAAGYALVAAAAAPDSRGQIQLSTADPLMAPVINPGFLTDQRDTGPAGGRAGDDPPGRRQPGVLLPGPRHRNARPVPRSAPAPGCASTSGARSAATGTRPAPAGMGPDTDPGRGRRPAAAGPRDHRPARRRRLGDPGHPQRPAERHRAGHRRESRQLDHRPGLTPGRPS